MDCDPPRPGRGVEALGTLELGTRRPGTEVSRALRAQNPKRVRKESERASRGLRPRRGPRVPKECAPESEKSPKTQLRTFFGLFSDSVAHSLGTLGLPRAGPPFGLFSDSFGVPGPKGPGDLCAWSAGSQRLRGRN